jgi:RNA polymerase sigma factor (sigma-70 family)
MLPHGADNSQDKPSRTPVAAVREADALAALARGEMAGLKAIYEWHATPLLNFAWRMLKNRAAAEDAVHELFLRMPHLMAQFRGECSLKTWLFRAMHNQCLNGLAVEKNRQSLLRRELPKEEAMADELAADQKIENAQRLESALARVPPETRSLLWMKDAEGMSLEELVLIFKEPEGTLKARLSRARHLIREAYAKEVAHE